MDKKPVCIHCIAAENAKTLKPISGQPSQPSRLGFPLNVLLIEGLSRRDIREAARRGQLLTARGIANQARGAESTESNADKVGLLNGMDEDVLPEIQAIHKSPHKAAIYATGRGLQVRDSSSLLLHAHPNSNLHFELYWNVTLNSNFVSDTKSR